MSRRRRRDEDATLNEDLTYRFPKLSPEKTSGFAQIKP